MNRFVLPFLIEKDTNGYFACAPSRQGCCAQGDSYTEALASIVAAVRLHLEDRVANGEPIPTPA